VTLSEALLRAIDMIDTPGDRSLDSICREQTTCAVTASKAEQTPARADTRSMTAALDSSLFAKASVA